MRYLKKIALITGASAGLGAEFAEQLAAQGADLVLCARRLERLNALADSLRSKHKVHIEVIAQDLANADGAEELLKQLDQRQIHVDILINNAGYGLPGYLLSQPWSEHARSLQLMLNAPTQLCRALLPAMQEKGFGRIINVASLAGLVPPSAGHTTYGAIKSYLIRFSESLALEHGQKQIKILALCPGFTYTEFHDANGARARVGALPKILWMDAATVVRQALDASETNRRVYVNGWINFFLACLAKILPNAWASALTNSQASKFREPTGTDSSRRG